jgi:DNA end-binding protein Ku
MPRAIWSGSISFGLINVPVKLHAAVRDKDVHFHQLDEKSGSRIRYKRVSEKSGREVPYERIVKGYELPRGEFVTFTDEELEAVEPERSHTIAVEDFVELAEVDPLHFDTTYWVVPDDSQGASKAYALLRSVMDATERIAIGRFVLRTKEHLVALRPVGSALAIHLMHFPDEIVPASEIDGLPVRAKVTDREVTMAERLVDSLTVKWKPSRYKNTHREQVLDMIEQKAKGEEIVIPEAPEPAADVVDLMEALEASLAKKRRSRRKRAS